MPTYLITGAYSGMHVISLPSFINTNRVLGLGLGLAGYYLSQNNNIIIAGVRDPSDPRTKDLTCLPAGKGSSLIIVKIDSASETSAQVAVDELRTKHNIEVIDVAIENAAIATIVRNCFIHPSRD
jgi:norsolorinic acid ketoreductase